jgi:hypothetical protein
MVKNMTDIIIPSDLLGQFVGVILFETSLIIGLLIQEHAQSHENQGALTFSQQLEGWKIASGLLASGIAVLVFLGFYPLIPQQPQPDIVRLIGFGLFWIGLTLIVNGVFTQKKAFHSIEQKIDRLIENKKL